MLERISDWRGYLSEGITEADLNKLRSHSNTGLPCGSEEWIDDIEQKAGRNLKRKKPGPKPMMVT